MGLISNLSVAKRLSLGFALVLALSIAVIGLSIAQLNQLADDTQAMMQKPILTERLVSDWARNLSAGITRTVAVARSSDPDLADFFDAAAKDSSRRSTLLQKQVQELMLSEQEKKLFDEIGVQRGHYLKGRDTIFALKREGRTDEANALLQQQFLPQSEAYADRLDALLAHQREQVNQLAQAIEHSRSSSSVLLVVLGVLSVGLSVLISWLLSSSITRPLAQASKIAERVAAGDLTATIEHHGRDELGKLMAALQKMQDSLAAEVSNVRRGAESVSNASAEIAQGNHDLSARTEHQASALEQTAASMEQLSSTVRHNADNARQANQLALTASNVAAQGGAVVSEVVQTMRGINEASSKINDIIGVIDSIAFQTNILALNAAVEAARAGEQGRGFAVVASEVRSLAQRSADAAKEIKALIGASVEQVAQGSALVDKAGETMNEVVNSIRRVTDIMGEISAASNEQSTGVAQVSEAVTSMDQSTQQNAALVEEMAAAASSLRVQSSELVEAVSVFRLSVGQGSATTIAHAAPPAPSLAPATTKPTARPAAAAKAAAPAAPPPVAAPRPAAAAATPAARSKAGTPPALTAAPPAKATQAASEDDWETF